MSFRKDLSGKVEKKMDTLWGVCHKMYCLPRETLLQCLFIGLCMNNQFLQKLYPNLTSFWVPQSGSRIYFS